MNFLSTVFFGVNREPFLKGVQQAIDSLAHKDGIYTGDNIITWGRNLSFFSDEKFMAAWRAHANTAVEEAIVWRVSVVAWAARSVISRRVPGDLVECACAMGTTARIICDYTEFAAQQDRTYYLYDLFDPGQTMQHHDTAGQVGTLYDKVKARFIDVPNVRVLKGSVPEVLHVECPQRVAFMHIDLNNAPAEIGALEMLFDRLSPGGILILDDYGWLGYRAQKQAEDPWLAARGYQVLELPTGQGLVFK